MAQPGPEQRDLVRYGELFSDAHREGAVSADTLRRVQNPSVQRYLTLASGHSAKEATSNRIHLVTFFIDNSGSMHGNQDAVIEGYKFVLTEIAKSPEARDMWTSTQLLNGERSSSTALTLRSAELERSKERVEAGILDPYAPLLENGHIRSVMLNRDNYQPHGGTPLYARSEETLLAVLGKAEEFKAEWREVTTATLLMSDGGDTSHTGPDEVAKRVRDLQGTGTHIVAAMGFGREDEFIEILTGMGIQRGWILTARSTPDEVRRALTKFANVVKKSAATPITDYRRMLSSGWQGTSK